MKGWSQWLLLMFFVLFVFLFTLFYFPVGSLDVFSSSLHMTIIEDVGSTRGDYSFIGLVAIWCDIGSNTFILYMDRTNVCDVGNCIISLVQMSIWILHTFGFL